ncbi:MAG: proline--tRNA ligase [Phycisphaerae bacterium]|jgi:prolyl-tRNA synthetase
MRYSQLLIPTVKEVPAEAEIASHQLMIRAGFIRKLASGTYTYLPLGWRSLLKIIAIVRAEMNAAGAQEISMPILQPMELWQQTGRDVVFKDILCSFEDRHGRKNVLAPTAEEVVTALVAAEVSSYKQLPLNLYQIHDKFRDEYRPQYGVVRSREFIMKDAYSFDATVEGLNESYRKMYDAYRRIFDRCGLKYAIVQADSGGMGGTDTEEFMVPATVGDILVFTEDNSYAANIEKAEVDALKIDAAGLAARAAAPALAEAHTPGVGSIEAVCKFLGTKPAEMIKTLIFWKPDRQLLADWENHSRRMVEKLGKLDNIPDLHMSAVERRTQSLSDEGRQYVASAKRLFDITIVALVRGDHEVNESKLKGAIGGDIELAGESVIQSLTGAAVGFAGPQGLAGKVAKLIIDPAVAAMVSGATGANKTDYHVRNVVPGRDFPLEGDNVIVADIRNAAEGDTRGGKKLVFSNGIEVGHVFKLGTKYSEQLKATFLDAQGVSRPCIMGCYGIGVNRILATAIESSHDENGPILPISIAPFEVEIVPLSVEAGPVMETAQRIYDELRAAGADVLLDDREARPGVKFKDADLIGIPLRVVVGEKGLKDGKVEIKRRTEPKATLVDVASAVETARGILDELRQQVQARQ